jgi:hypothetical protein
MRFCVTGYVVPDILNECTGSTFKHHVVHGNVRNTQQCRAQTRRPESSVTLLYKPLDLNNNKTSSPVKAQEFYG